LYKLYTAVISLPLVLGEIRGKKPNKTTCHTSRSPSTRYVAVVLVVVSENKLIWW